MVPLPEGEEPDLGLPELGPGQPDVLCPTAVPAHEAKDSDYSCMPKSRTNRAVRP